MEWFFFFNDFINVQLLFIPARASMAGWKAGLKNGLGSYSVDLQKEKIIGI